MLRLCSSRYHNSSTWPSHSAAVRTTRTGLSGHLQDQAGHSVWSGAAQAVDLMLVNRRRTLIIALLEREKGTHLVPSMVGWSQGRRPRGGGASEWGARE
jgi:hypothetical protein